MISKSFYFCLIILGVFVQDVSAQNFDAEVVKYTTHCVVEKDKLMQTDSVTIQINNRVGDEYTEISIPYSKNEKVSDLDAWIENMDGAKVRVLKKSDIIDRSAFSEMYLYEDHYIKCFQLKHNVYPYRVVYTYKTTSRDFIGIGWSPILYNNIPTRKAVLNIIIPKNIPFKKYVNNITDGFRIDSTSANLLLQWTASYNKPVKAEIYSQPEDIKPYVIVAPLNFQYGIEGSTKDWESYGNWNYRLCQDLDMLPTEEKNTISTLIKDVTDKREIVKILYHYLQDHTRYINVSIGIGGHKPYPASYVAQNKYGDCKALTNYMKAMLSYVGIESFYTTVYADEQPRQLIKNFSGPQFNHVVLVVPLKNDTIWLENTKNTNAFGYMGTFTQNREALLNGKDHSRLIRVPALKAEDVHVSYNMDFDLNILGSGKVKLNISFKGGDFEMFNELQADYNDVEKDRFIREYMPFDNYEVINWNLKKLHRDTARIELNAALNLNKFIKPLGNEYYFSIYPCRIPAFAPPANRILPVELPFPICKSYLIIYNLPAGYEMKSKFELVSIKTPFGTYESAINVYNSKIFVTKRFELYHGSYSLGQYADLYAFIQSVKDVDRKKIIIKPKN
jgi:hypothetical protein